MSKTSSENNANNAVTVAVSDGALVSPHSDLWITTLPSVITLIGSLAIVLISSYLQRKGDSVAAERLRQMKALEDIAEGAKQCHREVLETTRLVFKNEPTMGNESSINKVFAMFLVHFPDRDEQLMLQYLGSYFEAMKSISQYGAARLMNLPAIGSLPQAEFLEASAKAQIKIEPELQNMKSRYATFVNIEKEVFKFIGQIASEVLKRKKITVKPSVDNASDR